MISREAAAASSRRVAVAEQLSSNNRVLNWIDTQLCDALKQEQRQPNGRSHSIIGFWGVRLWSTRPADQHCGAWHPVCVSA